MGVVFSSHIFMFPFSFIVDKEKQNPNDLNFNLDLQNTYIEYLNGYFNDTKFPSLGKSSFDENTDYNEKKFFHDFTHDAILSGDDIKVFSRSLNGWKYNIAVEKKIKNRKNRLNILEKEKLIDPPKYETIRLSLNLNKVEVLVYKEGVGILSYHLDYIPDKKTNKEDLLDNVLIINQYGRRIFPPFLDTTFGNFNLELDSPVDGTIYRELAREINIVYGGDIYYSTCNFSKFTIIDDFLPEHIFKTLGLEKKEESKKARYTFNNQDIEIKPLLDDRMFVMSWLGCESISQQSSSLVKEEKETGYYISGICNKETYAANIKSFYENAFNGNLTAKTSSANYGYVENDFWYKYVFVDSSSRTCQNDFMLKELLDKHTYARWVENYTLYGVSRYSFVMITDIIDKLKAPKNNAEYIINYFKTIYFKMASFVLFQRCMILKYTSIINDYYKSNNDSVKNSLESYSKYQKFINKYSFREVTAQEQGIELYNMLMDNMKVDYLKKELENEYNRLFQISEIDRQKDEKEKENKQREIESEREKDLKKREKIFTILGSTLAVPSLLFGLRGTKMFEKEISVLDNIFYTIPGFSAIQFLVLTLIIAIITYMTGLIWYKNDEKIKETRLRKKHVSTISFILFLIFISYYILTYYLYES